jgi:hypothetical protein
LIVASVLAGCTPLGPQVLTTARPLYNVAIAQTEAQQLLLNIVRQMLTPLDLRIVALIVQSGWRIERVLLIIGESVNQVRNTTSSNDANGYLQFQVLAGALRDLQRSGLLSIGTQLPEEGEEPALILMFDPSAVESDSYRMICETLRVACDGNSLRLQQAIGISSDGRTMALATRSLFSALFFLAQGVDVPSRDTAAGVASASSSAANGSFDQTSNRGQLFHVRTSATEPALASVKVFYRDACFYIADDDLLACELMQSP